jgi:hypothetical protein
MVLPAEIVSSLEAAGLAVAGENLAAWVREQGLPIVRTTAPKVPTFQIVIPVRPAHPLLTIQPLPNNPDVPTQKMRAVKRSPYSNLGPRKALIDELNSGLPDADKKEPQVGEKMFKIRWVLLAESRYFGHVRGVLDRVIQRVREEFPAAGAP